MESNTPAQQDLSAAKPESVEVTPDATQADTTPEQVAPEEAPAVNIENAQSVEVAEPTSDETDEADVPEELTEEVVPEVEADENGDFVSDEPEDAPHGEEF